MRTKLLLGTLCVFAGACAHPRAEVRVTPVVLNPVDHRLFGHFLERPSGGEIGVEAAVRPDTGTLDPAVAACIRKLAPPVLRFPGGTDVDYLDWRDMVAHVPGRTGGRPISRGKEGHGVTNRFGYDEFLRLCEAVDAEPLLVVNVGDALRGKKPIEEAAWHAAALLAYVNGPLGRPLPRGLAVWPRLRARNGHPKPYGVRYVQLGNETWRLLREARHPDPAGHYRRVIQAYVRALRAVDPQVELVLDGPVEGLAAITPQVLDAVGNEVDWLAFHLYGPGPYDTVIGPGERRRPAAAVDPERLWYAWVAVPGVDEAGQSVLQHPVLRFARARGLQVAVTEWNWNGWGRFRPPSELDDPFVRAMGAAGILHAFMRSGDVIRMACQSILVGRQWLIAGIAVDPQGEEPPRLRPTAALLELYGRHHGRYRLKVQLRGGETRPQPYRVGGIRPKPRVALLDVLATADEEAVYVHLLNRDFKRPWTVTVDLAEIEGLAHTGRHHLLQGRTAPGTAFERSVRELRGEGDRWVLLLPPRSISVLAVPRRASRIYGKPAAAQAARKASRQG